MPIELPGFFYDSEKNRYFPIKGSIPGSHTQKPPPKPDKANDHPTKCRRKEFKTSNLLHVRELYGKLLSFDRRKCDFQQEYQKNRSSRPMIWKYQRTGMFADSALEQLHVDIQTPEGQFESNVLLTGSMNSCLSLYEVQERGQHFDYGIECMPDFVWPVVAEQQAEGYRAPAHIWRPAGYSTHMYSSISCVQRIQKNFPHIARDGPKQALIATLGSETSSGSIYMLNLSDPLDPDPTDPTLRRRLSSIALANCTIWSADCNSKGSEAVIGTNHGSALVNLETGVLSWVCRCKSDVFSLKFDHSGNTVICGFRNGAIVTVDVRQRQGHSARLPTHQISSSLCTVREPSSSKRRKLTKRLFELKGNIRPSCTTYMPSSISSLVCLQTYDQYFLASSMDGSIKLYDHRQMQRGAVQSYEGHVNSHTRIQLGVDPSENIVMSGGEDGYIRIWSIKTAELLCSTKISNSAPSVMCCPGTGKLQESTRQKYEKDLVGQNYSWEAWLGSYDGLYYVQGP